MVMIEYDRSESESGEDAMEDGGMEGTDGIDGGGG